MGGGVVGNTLNVVINVVGEEIVRQQKIKLIEEFKKKFPELVSDFL